MAINGVTVLEPLIEGTPARYSISYVPPAGLAAGQTLAVIDASDLAGNAMASSSWSFTVGTDPLLTPDGAPLADAGLHDSPAGQDSGAQQDAGGVREAAEAGCSCSTSTPASSHHWGALALLLAGLLSWRARRSTTAPALRG